MNLYESVRNNLKESDNFKDMVMELHGYVDYADPKKIAKDVKEALKNKTLGEYLKSKAAMDDDEIKAFKEKYAINESEEDKYEDPNYSIDTSNLVLTNGGYHNNTESIYGRVRLLPNNSEDYVKTYDIIYIPENDWLYVFKPGTDVRSAIEGTYLYDGDHDNDWIKWNGQRVQIKDLWDLLDKIKLSISKEEENALIAELSDIYFDDDKHDAINKVNYQ